MFLYVFILSICLWNMLTASVLTIPLYRLLCHIYTTGIALSDVVKCVEVGMATDTSHIAEAVQHACCFVQCVDYTSPYVPYQLCASFFTQHHHSQNICIVVGSVHEAFHLDESLYTIYSAARVSNLTLLEFHHLQSSLATILGDSAMAFFRIYNPISIDITCLSMYYMYPASAAAYISKVQCLCFDTLCIRSLETVELPVLFHISDALPAYINSVFPSYVIFMQ